MANTIKLKRGTSTPSTSDISSGEVAIDTSAQKLYINDSGTVKEIGGGTTVGGATGVDFNDDVKVRFGTGNDLQIFADGSNSEIQHNGDGHLLIKSGFGTTAIKCVESGAVELNHNGSKKAETVSGGFTVTGTCTATAFSGDGSALTGISAGPGTGQQYVNLETGNSASNTGVNTFAGYLAGNAFTSADHTTLFGYQAGSKITGAGNNCFFGSNAGKETTGVDNCGFGQAALETNTSGASNVAVGRQALYANESGSSNVAIGKEAGKLVTGSEGVFIGASCGTELTSGSANTFVGSFSGQAVCGSHNVAVGSDAFRYGTGGTNTCVGRQAGYISNFSGSNNLLLGYQADPTSASTSNEITLGNTSITKFRIPGLNFSLKDTTATEDYVLTVDANGDCGWEAASASDSTKLPLAGGTMTGHLLFGDGIAAKFGASNDLEIEHTGSNSTITDSGTGKLILKSDNQIELVAANNESMIEAVVDGATKFYYDGVKKFETTSYGVLVSSRLNASTISIPDYNSSDESGAIKLGTGNDLQLYHSGSHSYIKDTGTGALNVCASALYVTNAADSENMVAATENGAVNLYYDNVKRFETTSAGISIMGTIEASGNLDLPDWGQLKLGTGDDILIYHTGTDSYFKNTTNDLYIQNTGDDTYIIATDDIYLKNGDDWAIKCIGDGATELYYDNSKKFETTAQGIIVGGDVDNSTSTQGVALQTGGKIRSRVADTSATAFVVSIEDSGASKAIINGAGNGYFAGGLDVPDSAKIQAGNGDDLKIYHDGSHSIIDNNTGTLYLQSDQLNINNSASNEGLAKFYANGAVELNYDNSKKLETTSSGVKITTDLVTTGNCSPSADGGGNLGSADYSWYNLFVNNDIHVADNGVIQLGDGNDLKILHDSGGDSYIQDKGSGNLYITGDDIIIQNNDTSENIAKFIENSYVSFYFDNSQKFYTQSYGCVCAGDFKPESNNTYNLGDSSYRWANLYVNDMHFSNEGKSNSVDGTWGDWTLQEGDENIFMINNRTGKKYKMGLQEVS